MSAHDHDEQLSAFYDGELPVEERLEVERLLTANAELRGALNIFTDISHRLSDLADDIPPVDLRDTVLDRIGRSVATASLPVSTPAPVSSAVNKPRFWMPLLLASASLVLLVAMVLPLIQSVQDQQILVMNAPESAPAMTMNREADRGAIDAPMAAPATTVPMTAVSPPALMADALHGQASMKEVHAPLVAHSIASHPADVGASTYSDSVDQDWTDSRLEEADDEGAGPSAFLADLERQRGLKPGEIVSHLIESSEGLWIVEFMVVDIQRGATEFEVLLKQNGIIPIGDATAPGQTESGVAATPDTGFPVIAQSPDTPLKAILVDSEINALNSAINDSQKLEEVVNWSLEPLEFSAPEALIAKESADTPNGGITAPQSLEAAAIASNRPAAMSSTAPLPPAVGAPLPARIDPADRSIATDNTPDDPASEKTSQSRGPMEEAPLAGDASRHAGRSSKAKAMADRRRPGDFSSETDQASRRPRGKGSINGNSLELPHGVEIVAELQQLQLAPEQLQHRMALRGDVFRNRGQALLPHEPQPSDNKLQSSNNPVFRIQSPDSISRNQANVFNYSNPPLTLLNTRSRQRALLVLRSAPTPPPPPEPSPLDP